MAVPSVGVVPNAAPAARLGGLPRPPSITPFVFLPCTVLLTNNEPLTCLLAAAMERFISSSISAILWLHKLAGVLDTVVNPRDPLRLLTTSAVCIVYVVVDNTPFMEK